MPLPATVDASLSWPSWKNAGSNLYEVGGNLYVVGLDKTNNHVEMWKSTDGGSTWTEQDAANHKALNTTAANKTATACVDGTRILVIYGHPSAGFIGMAPYETTTDLWGTALAITATGITTDVTTQVPLAVACRGSNDYVAAFASATESIMGTAYRRISVRPFTSTTAGTVVVVESGVQQHQDLVGLAVGASGRVHVLYRNATGNTLRQRAFLSSNTLGTAGDVDASINTVINIYVGGVPTSYIDGADTKVVVPYVDAGGELNVGRFTSADAPTYTTQVVTAVTDNKPRSSGCNPGAVAADGTTVHAFWADSPFGDLWRDNDGGTGTWGTDVEHRDAITVGGVNVATITNAIGIFYDDAGTVKYDAYSLGAPVYPKRPTIVNQAVRRAVTR